MSMLFVLFRLALDIERQVVLRPIKVYLVRERDREGAEGRGAMSSRLFVFHCHFNIFNAWQIFVTKFYEIFMHTEGETQHKCLHTHIHVYMSSYTHVDNCHDSLVLHLPNDIGRKLLKYVEREFQTINICWVF